MKTSIRRVLVCMFALALIMPAEAQFLNQLIKSAEKSAEKAVQKEVNKKVNQGVHKAFNPNEKKEKGEGQQGERQQAQQADGWTCPNCGHQGNTGNATINQALSEQRANAIVAKLVEKGISPYRLTAKGMGQSSPIADNSTDEGRAKNRRVEFVKK